MKKIVKNNEKAPAYIGGDCFDPAFIEKPEKGEEFETYEISGPETII